jgi:hypothetical protein
MVEESTKKGPVCVNFPPELLERVDDYVAKTYQNRTTFILLACSEQLRRLTEPGLVADEIRAALRESPELVAEAIQIYSVRSIQKK